MSRVALGEICEILNGYAFKSERYVDSGVRIIRITNVQKGYVEDEKPQFYSEEDMLCLQEYLLNEGDLLISLTGNVGRVALLEKDFLPAALNQRVACLRSHSNKVNIKYVYYTLLSKKFEDDCVKSAKGIAQKNMSTEWLKQYMIELPEIDMQNEIVHIFDKLLIVVKGKMQQLFELDNLIKSRFVELFGDLKSNNKGWKIVGFKECADIDTNMIHNFEGYEDYPHIGIDSIEKETGRLVGYRTIAEDGVISGKYLFSPAHIIYSKIRPNLNKVAMPNFEGLCSADAYPILVKEGICNREYLGYTLRSKYFLDYILAFSNRTNLPKVNKNQVEGFTLPLPPIDTQEQFAEFVKQVDKLKFELQNSLNETKKLMDSLMQQYFG